MTEHNMREKKLRGIILSLANCYPEESAKFSYGNTTAYVKTLGRFTIEVINKGISRAMSESPKKLPSALAIKHHCEMIAGQGDVTEAQINQPPSEPGHELPSNHPFSRLARVWEDQSKQLGLDPDKPCPKNIAKQRFKQFWQVWDLCDKMKEVK